MRFDNNYWAVILGASSGFGLATAKKLAAHGMKLCLVHRDRRGAMKRIEKEFDKVRQHGGQVITCNQDALSQEGRNKVLDALSEAMAEEGKVRLLLHSLALGNLKLLAPMPGFEQGPEQSRNRLAALTGVSVSSVHEAVDVAFGEGDAHFHSLADNQSLNDKYLLDEEDFAGTIHAMGTSLATWTRTLFLRNLFFSDARVLSFTSEGNAVAWRGYAAVSAAKAALEAVTRSLAVEYAPHGIRANVIQPGVADTPAFRAIPGNRHMEARARLRNPLGRLTNPDDVANMVYLLSLDEAAWVNGALIPVDGGERIA